MTNPRVCRSLLSQRQIVRHLSSPSLSRSFNNADSKKFQHGYDDISFSNLFSLFQPTTPRTKPMYTGRQKIPTTLHYYESIIRLKQATPIDPQHVQKLFSFSSETKKFSYRSDCEIGDIVECVSRDGKDIALGIIVSTNPSKSQIQIYTPEDNLKTFSASCIRFVIPHIFEKKYILRTFPQHLSIPSSSNDSPDTDFFFSPTAFDTNERETYLKLLRLIVGASYERISKDGLEQAFSVIYAHASSYSVRTYSIDEIATNALQISRDREFYYSNTNHILKSMSKLTATLAAHMWTSNMAEFWFTLPHKNGMNEIDYSASPNEPFRSANWLPVPTVAAEDSSTLLSESIDNVVDKDLIIFAKYIKSQIKERYPEKYDIENYQEEEDETENLAELINDDTIVKFSKILGLLRRYIVYPHEKFAPIIDPILQVLYPNVYTNSIDTEDPTSNSLFSRKWYLLHKILIDSNMITTENPYLDSGLLLDYDRGQIVDEYTRRAIGIEPKSVIYSDELHMDITHKKWPKEIPVYAFYLEKHNPKNAKPVEDSQALEDDAQETQASETISEVEENQETEEIEEAEEEDDDDTELKPQQRNHIQTARIAISVEEIASSPNKRKLHIHVPNIASWYLPISKLIGIGIRRARTVWLPEGIRELFPRKTAKRILFADAKMFNDYVTEKLENYEQEKLQRRLKREELLNNEEQQPEQQDSQVHMEPLKKPDLKIMNKPDARCLTFTIEFDIDNPTMWASDDISISLTNIPHESIKFYALEDVGKEMNWILNINETGDDGENQSLTRSSTESPEDTWNMLAMPEDNWSDEVESFSESPMGSRSFGNNRYIQEENNLLIQSETSPTEPTEMDFESYKMENNRIKTITETEKTHFQFIYDFLEENYWKRMKLGRAVYESETEQYDQLVKIGAKVQQQQQEELISTSLISKPSNSSTLLPFLPEFILTESNMVTGEVAAILGRKFGISLLYERQDRLRPFDLELPKQQQTLEYDGTNSSTQTKPSSAMDLWDSNGNLTQTGRYLAASSQYLGSRRITTSPDYIHHGFGLVAGFAGTARPLDDMTHVLNQFQLTATFASSAINLKNRIDKTRNAHEPGSFKSIPWRSISSGELQSIHDTRLVPRSQAFSQLEAISQRYWVLRWLEDEMLDLAPPAQQASRSRGILNVIGSTGSSYLSTMPSGYYVFRCIIVSQPPLQQGSSSSSPDFVQAYCVELGLEVSIALPQDTSESLSSSSINDNKEHNGSKRKKKSSLFDKIKRFGTDEEHQQQQKMKLKEGDRIITTSILELDPISGHIVLGM